MRLFKVDIRPLAECQGLTTGRQDSVLKASRVGKSSVEQQIWAVSVPRGWIIPEPLSIVTWPQ
jgi:stage V sporulation protein SpoVS